MKAKKDFDLWKAKPHGPAPLCGPMAGCSAGNRLGAALLGLAPL